MRAGRRASARSSRFIRSVSRNVFPIIRSAVCNPGPRTGFRERPRREDRDRRARGVVVGARRFERRVHHVGAHRVEVTRDDERRLRADRIGAREDRDDVLHVRRLVVRARRRRLERVHDDLERRLRLRRDRAESSGDDAAWSYDMKFPFDVRLWILIAALFLVAGGTIYGLSSAWHRVQQLETMLPISGGSSSRVL